MNRSTTENLACAEEIGALIRTDTKGRARYDAAFRQRVIEAYAASGMSVMAFSRHCGLKYPTLAAWVSKARNGGRSKVAKRVESAPKFLVAEVGVAPQAGYSRPGVLELEVAPGMMARASDGGGVALLAELVHRLSQNAGGGSC